MSPTYKHDATLNEIRRTFSSLRPKWCIILFNAAGAHKSETHKPAVLFISVPINLLYRMARRAPESTKTEWTGSCRNLLNGRFIYVTPLAHVQPWLRSWAGEEHWAAIYDQKILWSGQARLGKVQVYGAAVEDGSGEEAEPCRRVVCLPSSHHAPSLMCPYGVFFFLAYHTHHGWNMHRASQRCISVLVPAVGKMPVNQPEKLRVRKWVQETFVRKYAEQFLMSRNSHGQDGVAISSSCWWLWPGWNALWDTYVSKVHTSHCQCPTWSNISRKRISGRP